MNSIVNVIKKDKLGLKELIEIATIPIEKHVDLEIDKNKLFKEIISIIKLNRWDVEPTLKILNEKMIPFELVPHIIQNMVYIEPENIIPVVMLGTIYPTEKVWKAIEEKIK